MTTADKPANPLPASTYSEWARKLPRRCKHKPLTLDIMREMRDKLNACAGISTEEVRQQIKGESGRHFDPRVVEAFLELEDLSV